MKSQIDEGQTMAGAAQSSTILAELLAQSCQTEAESQAASRSASAAAANVRMVHGRMSELTRGIDEIDSHVGAAQQRITRATLESDKTLQQVRSLSLAVDAIASTANLIDQIASATNMLALNATIEAARAGDKGRGFAVVAGEVKALSRQTAQATETVQQQLAAIRQASQEVISAVGTLNDNLFGVQTQIEAVSAAVGERNSSLDSIAVDAKDAADTVQHIAVALDNIGAAARATCERIRRCDSSPLS